MQLVTQPIRINGVEISPGRIDAEVQYHQAPTLPEARYEAMRALVVRELLVQRAIELGLADRETINGDADEVIEKLLTQELKTPDPTSQECQTYYQNNLRRFHTSPIYEVSHILYLAPPDEPEARATAQARANVALAELKEQASLFENLARRDSACSSAKDGGFLGQVTQGQTLPPFEAALNRMKPADISSAPVETDVGYHIIKLHHMAPGAQLPFEAVEHRIADHLRQQVWNRALSQYIRILAGQATISGFKLDAAESPLVQ